MPWKETCPMSERAEFIVECARGELSMSELCRKYEISRKTGYKWWERFHAGGRPALRDRSRAAATHPNTTPEAVERMVVELRKAHPTWGPRKLGAWLQLHHPRMPRPSPSTIGAIVARAGLVRRRRRRQGPPPYAAPFGNYTAPNAIWCADFKGGFALGNGRRCHPLTLSDGYSRYLLRCEGLRRTDEPSVRPIFESAFAEFGRPHTIRTDNGPPFATVAAGGLSRLAIWWIKLGIRAERIAPGQPQQNGRHERLHRTLKADTTKPPALTLADQQRVFDRFRRVYNDERPHEALGQRPPATIYTPSPRPYPIRLREPAYPATYQLRRVGHDGAVHWRSHTLYLAETLADETIGFEEIDNDVWRLYFADVPLGVLTGHRFQRLGPRAARATHSQARNKVLPMRPV
jgi:transposase InsO family protein